MDSPLKVRAVVVTGAAPGTGAVPTNALARRGAGLALLDHDEQALQALAADLPGVALALPIDCPDSTALTDVAKAIRRHPGPPPVVVANAGTAEGGTFALAVADADESGSRLQERSGTVGLGATGPAYLASDRAEAALGVWACHRPVRDFGAWPHGTSLRLRLVNGDAFAAATFYGEVLKRTRPGGCGTRCEKDDAVLIHAREPVAWLRPDVLEAPPGPLLRPHRLVFFTVEDPDKVVSRTEYSGRVTGEYEDTAGRWTMLMEPERVDLTLLAPHVATAGSRR
ncbi:SDR family NAD(P)-dependent oxidoreductase [Streptomyces sp. NPDC058286]|uniref:SDR family NAD(P)-dependent oxidoreductase n=1 Tax=Streptomyces sp. NPDC058286 TaxID=3346422 RepID=UPI0036F0875F